MCSNGRFRIKAKIETNGIRNERIDDSKPTPLVEDANGETELFVVYNQAQYKSRSP